MFKASELLEQQLNEVVQWHVKAPEPDYVEASDFPNLVSMQHYVNFELWHQEDMARDPDAPDSKIAAVKRAIDVLNQRRNDMIEQMDQYLLDALQSKNIKYTADAEMNSETPGSIIDRLSINALKIYHMDEEIQRLDVTDEHRKKCSGKLSVLQDQRNDLKKSLETLLADLSSGKKRLKVYQQMKMYNDENLNPVLYQKGKN
ncbi:MAG: DUF4254 domain-containing protein [SAR324 cluster bacterium]|nr:DUF4254 domain-containing protein [SAR324 cluster bacterium]MCS5554609.1 DUF4254 domain-containing protein [SAR324 cluster bacterium]